jgi:multicomponent Na+:H+ antiporter subunit E
MTGPRRIAIVVLLVFAWCALWGSPTPANIASGFVVAIIVAMIDIGPPGRGGVRIRPLLRFARLVAVDLVISTVNVVREVITPTDHTEESIVAVRLPIDSRAHLLLMVVAITVTPGTAVVDTDPDDGTLYLHLLHDRRRQATIDHVRELADLACAALPIESSSTEAAEVPLVDVSDIDRKDRT